MYDVRMAVYSHGCRTIANRARPRCASGAILSHEGLPRAIDMLDIFKEAQLMLPWSAHGSEETYVLQEDVWGGPA